MRAVGEGEVIDPPFEDWITRVRESISRRDVLERVLDPSLVKSIRRETVERAIEHSQELMRVAKEVGIDPLIVPCASRYDEKAPLCMSGHQPVVYHPGLLRKSTGLTDITAAVGGLGINVVIDTDLSDGGAISWPKRSGQSLEIKRGMLVRRSGIGAADNSNRLFCDEVLASAAELRELFSEIEHDLEQSGLSGAAAITRQVAARYIALAERPLALAHSLVLWSLGQPGYREVPLSTLITTTRLSEVLAELVRDALRFSTTYNACLDSYRHSHKIQNRANPFPNVSVTDTAIEVPLWLLSAGMRKPLVVSRTEKFQPTSGEVIAPRGSITTLLLRAYSSDLFIHGRGGGKYDLFVDQLAGEYLGVELPPFVIASETRYLFPQQVEDLSRRVELAGQVKDMISRTESFLGLGIFSDEEERELTDLVRRRNSLRSEMQRPLSPDERRVVAHALNEENRKAREILQGGSLKTVISEAAKNEAELTTWQFREFPFWFFRAADETS